MKIAWQASRLNLPHDCLLLARQLAVIVSTQDVRWYGDPTWTGMRMPQTVLHHCKTFVSSEKGIFLDVLSVQVVVEIDNMTLEMNGRSLQAHQQDHNRYTDQ